MNICFTRRGSRARLICRRRDGSIEAGDLGPSLPHHDLAHFVVEKRLALTHGFYGNVARGYTMPELADKEVIRQLGPESWLAEVVTRALQALSGGACTVEQFPELVRAELGHHGWPDGPPLSAELGREMLAELRSLVRTYESLGDGESMRLAMHHVD